jgi:hypothetical protein
MHPLTIDQWPAGVFSACTFVQPACDLGYQSELEGAIAALFQHGTPERFYTGGATCRIRFHSGSLFASPITNVMADAEV